MAASAAGAVGGAILGGLAGSAQGAVTGIKAGADRGSRSTPLAALTIAAVGAAGLLEWPVLLGVGGGVLALREFRRHSDESAPKSAPKLTAVRGGGEKAAAPKPASKATRKPAPKANTVYLR
jgi:hypothetical protein